MIPTPISTWSAIRLLARELARTVVGGTVAFVGGFFGALRDQRRTRGR